MHDLVAQDLGRLFSGAIGQGRAIDAIEARKVFGLQKYGQPLHVANGRDYVKDVDDEICDLVAYFRALLERHPDLGPVLGEDYVDLLKFLVRWRSIVPMLQALEDSLR